MKYYILVVSVFWYTVILTREIWQHIDDAIIAHEAQYHRNVEVVK